MLRQILNNIDLMGLQPFDIDVSEAFVIGELSSAEVTLADLALHDDCRALSFDVLEQLCASHMLVILVVANIATVFRTLIHCVVLQFFHRLPDHLLASSLPALMRELTEVNAVPKNLVDGLQEIAALLAIWAANVETRRHIVVLLSCLLLVHRSCVLLLLRW